MMRPCPWYHCIYQQSIYLAIQHDIFHGMLHDIYHDKYCDIYHDTYHKICYHAPVLKVVPPSAMSASKLCRYCKWAALTCKHNRVRNISLLLVQSAIGPPISCRFRYDYILGLGCSIHTDNLHDLLHHKLYTMLGRLYTTIYTIKNNIP